MSRSGSPVLAWTVVLLIGGLSLGGCSSFSADRPPLPDSTFTHLLIEMHLVKGRAQLPGASPLGFPEQVLRRHQVTRTEFDATMQYYSRRPGAFESLYNDVIDTLSAVQQRAVDRREATADTARADSSRGGTP